LNAKQLLRSKGSAAKLYKLSVRKVAIIGAGIIVLTLAKKLKGQMPGLLIDIFDKYSFPSSGTSIRDSGVLHAVLCYAKDRLKARFCREGTYTLSELIQKYGLPILNCGRLLVPHLHKNITNLLRKYTYAIDNGCDERIVDHDYARRVQPVIMPRDEYLWSHKTNVLDPEAVTNPLGMQIVDAGIVSIITKVLRVNSEEELLVTSKGVHRYDFIFNVAGPRSLDLYQRDTGRGIRHRLLPVLGQNVTIITGPEIRTSLYPVPDPEWPYLGIHITPGIRGSAIVKPNAVPIFRCNMDEIKMVEWRDF